MNNTKVKIKEICRIVSGTTPKTDKEEFWNGNISWITPAEIKDNSFYIYSTERTISQEGKDKNSLFLMPKGTVLLSSRAPIGKVAIAGIDMCCNQGFKNLICGDRVNNEFLYYFLKSKTDFLNSLGRGATFKELSKSIVENISISLPTLQEQFFIKEKLKKIDFLIELKCIVLRKLNELINSRFYEMFGDLRINPNNLLILPWNDIFYTSTGKLDSNAMVMNGKYPFFTCSKEIFHIDSYAFDCEALLLAGNNAAGIYDVKHYKGKFNAYQRTYVLRLRNNQWRYELFKIQIEI